jgi:hypothetical protein
MTDDETRALRDLACKASVHFRPFEPEFSSSTSDRLYQEYGVRIPPERVLELAVHYREIYKFTSGIKQEYFHPHRRAPARDTSLRCGALQSDARRDTALIERRARGIPPRTSLKLGSPGVSAPEDYDLVQLQARMAEQFPEDPPEVLFSIMHKVILYEYLL